MRQSNFTLSNFVVSEEFKQKLLAVWCERNNSDETKYSYNLQGKDLINFIKTELEDLNYLLFKFYEDGKGFGKDMINRNINSKEGYPKNREIIDLFCYYAYRNNYVNCVKNRLLPNNIVQYKTLISELNLESNIDIKDPLFSPQDDMTTIIDKKRSEKIQTGLNRLINLDYYQRATEYHIERMNCLVYAFSKKLFKREGKFDKLIIKDNKVFIDGLEEWSYVFSSITSSKKIPFAGGWYLNFEQRTFLEERLTLIFKEFPGNSINICEAGCASYIHHFTYVSIVVDALRAANAFRTHELHAQIWVLDEFDFPLYQIQEVHEHLIKPRKLFPMQFPGVDGYYPDFFVKGDFIEFLSQYFGLRYYDKLIETHCKPHNLCLKDLSTELKFDVITEHFLIRIDKDGYDIKKWLENICATYKSFAKQTLHVISAIGNNAKSENGYYFDLYKKNDFNQVNLENVWDIYDQNKFYGNQVNKGTEVTLDNYLVHWKYVKPSN